jgi:SnoaL-like domain
MSAALDVALAYHEAWANKDFERAMTYIADDIVCEAPPGRIEGAEAYRAVTGPFVEILERTELIATFGDEDTAIVLHDTDTIPLKHAPGAEHVTVAGGKIVHSHFVFDRLPFREAA